MAQRASESKAKRTPPGRPPFQSWSGEQPEEFTIGVAAYPPPLRFAAYESGPDEDEELEAALTEAVARHAEPDSIPDQVGDK